MKIANLPENYQGMLIDGKQQYWSFGQEYYRKHNGTVVYRHGKRVLDLAQHGAHGRLKELLKHSTEKQLNLFGG